MTPFKTSRDLFLNDTYFSNFCVLVQAVRQMPSPSDVPSGSPGGSGDFEQAKEKAKEKAKEAKDRVKKERGRVPKAPSGRR